MISVSTVSGSAADAARGAGRRDELAHEEGIAARALRDLSEQLLGQGDLSGSRECQPGRFLAAERRELDQPLSFARLVDEPAGLAAGE